MTEAPQEDGDDAMTEAPQKEGDDAASMLPDGTYDAFVIDAEVQDGGRIALELTIVAGELKGEVVEITAVGLDGDEISLLGMPATITVTDGAPHVRIDH